MKISVIFPDIWLTQNLTPQHRTVFRRVAECFTSLLGFSCVLGHSQASNSELPGSTGREKQWFSSAKWSQLPMRQDCMCIQWHFQDMDNSLRSNSKRCVMRHACLCVYCIPLNRYHQVWGSTHDRGWTPRSSLSFWDRETWKKECVTFQGNETASWTHCREEACERSSVGPVGKEQDVSQIQLSSRPPLKAKLFMWCLWGWVVWEFF